MTAGFDQAATPLVLARDWAEMQRFSAWLDIRFEALALTGDRAYAVRLCLEEAVSNVIMHGDGDSSIHVTLGRVEDGLVACVEDGGPAFDPVSAAPLPLPASMEAAAEGGFGLKLIRRYASSMTYRREAGVNRLELGFQA